MRVKIPLPRSRACEVTHHCRLGSARVWLAVFAAMALVGCSITPRKPQSITGKPEQLTHWQAFGRLAVSGTDSGGSGSFVWRQQGADATIDLRGPIGIGSLRVILSSNALRIETGDGREFDGADAQAELAARLGATIPTQDLRYWLLGIAAPGAHIWNSDDHVTTLTQQDWRIDYQLFGVTAGIRLPMKLVAVSGPAKVRIVIDRWQLR